MPFSTPVQNARAFRRGKSYDKIDWTNFHAVVLVEDGQADRPIYLQRPFAQEPEFAIASVNFKLSDLLEKQSAQQI